LTEWDSFEQAVESAIKGNPFRTRENIEERLRRALHQKENGRWGFKVDMKGWKGRNPNPDRINFMWQKCHSITSPTLILLGEFSDYTSMECAERIKSIIPECEIKVVSGANHSIAGDNPQGFYDAFIPFIREHTQIN